MFFPLESQQLFVTTPRPRFSPVSADVTKYIKCIPFYSLFNGSLSDLQPLLVVLLRLHELLVLILKPFALLLDALFEFQGLLLRLLGARLGYARVQTVVVVLGVRRHVPPRLPQRVPLWLVPLHKAVHVDLHHVRSAIALQTKQRTFHTSNKYTLTQWKG